MNYELIKLFNKLECLAASIKTADAEKFADISSEMYDIISKCRKEVSSLEEKRQPPKKTMSIVEHWSGADAFIFRGTEEQLDAIETAFTALNISQNYAFGWYDEDNIIEL